MSDYEELAGRVEAAMGPDRDLDRDIANLAHGYANDGSVPRFTASLDSALTLVPEGLLFRVLNHDPATLKPPCFAEVGQPSHSEYGQETFAATPALALTAACLRARASSLLPGGREGVNMDKDIGRVGVAETGSREPNPASGSGPAGFDPARVAVFLDCDGVLADFDTYAEQYFGMPPRAYEAKVGSAMFWRELESRGDFYRNLPLMPDAIALYEGVQHLNPTILTGCPRGNWAEAQKIAWAAEHFPKVTMITCRSADKRDFAKPGDVLIDDWHQHRHRWIEMGGIWITHTCAKTSLAALWAHYPALCDRDASLAEDAKRLSGEAAAPRAEGIANPLISND